MNSIQADLTALDASLAQQGSDNTVSFTDLETQLTNILAFVQQNDCVTSKTVDLHQPGLRAAAMHVKRFIMCLINLSRTSPSKSTSLNPMVRFATKLLSLVVISELLVLLLIQ